MVLGVVFLVLKPTHYQYLSLFELYNLVFNYRFVGTIYIGAFIFLLGDKIKYSSDACVLVRVPKRLGVIFMQLYDTAVLAVEYVMSTLIIFILVNFKYIRNIQYELKILLALLIITFISITGLLYIGELYGMLFNIIQGKAVSFFVLEVIILIFFFSKSQNFSLKEIFFDMYGSIIPNFFNNSVRTLIFQPIKNIFIGFNIVFLNVYFYKNRRIYGGKVSDEHN